MGSPYIRLTLIAAIWGSCWVAASALARDGVPAIHASLGRFAFGSIGLLVALAGVQPWPRPTGRQWVHLAAMGFFGVFLYNLSFFNGLRTVPAGRASLMATLQPSLVFVYACVFWDEKPTLRKLSGLLLSLLGASTVLTQASPAQLFRTGLGTGDLWILGTAVSWVAYTLIGRRVAGALASLPATAYAVWLGFAMLLAFSVLTGEGLPDFSKGSLWLVSGYLGLLGTSLAFCLYLRGIEQVGAAKASIFINLVPVFGVLTSNLFLGEPVTWATVAGGLTALAGVRLLTTSR